MRIGIDVDGCLADFNTSFIERCIRITGRDLFPPRPFDIPCWDYLEHYGYQEHEQDAVWRHIKHDLTFWFSLRPYADAPDVISRLRKIEQRLIHEVYFVTARPGVCVKYQTEKWLGKYSGGNSWKPTVLISKEKGLCAQALDLELYIDDRLENAVEVAKQTPCRVYLLTQPWNTSFCKIGSFTRVDSFNDMFVKEGLTT